LCRSRRDWLINGNISNSFSSKSSEGSAGSKIAVHFREKVISLFKLIIKLFLNRTLHMRRKSKILIWVKRKSKS
jgi:hypothetical protein